MNATDWKRVMQEASFCRCFLFGGEEEYWKRSYLTELRRRLITDETFASFNHMVMEGEKVDFSALKNAVLSPPMMADWKLVEWHGGNLGAWKDAELDQARELVSLVKESGNTCLVFLSTAEKIPLGNLPKRPGALYQSLSEFCDIVVCSRATDAQLLAWLERHFRHAELAVEADACRLLLEIAGRDMQTLLGEVAKLTALAKARNLPAVTQAEVRLVTSRGVDEDPFGLENAFLQGDLAGVFRALSEAKRNREDPLLLLGAIYRLVGDLHLIVSHFAEGLSDADIQPLFSYHAYKTGLRIKCARRLPEGATSKWLSLCLEADRRVKRGNMRDGFVVLESLLAQLLSK